MSALSVLPELKSLHGRVGWISSPHHYALHPCEVAGVIVDSYRDDTDYLVVRVPFGNSHELIDCPYSKLRISVKGAPVPAKTLYELDS
jgi:hypothetical protein